jgi:hypothetical protein
MLSASASSASSLLRWMRLNSSSAGSPSSIMRRWLTTSARP